MMLQYPQRGSISYPCQFEEVGRALVTGVPQQLIDAVLKDPKLKEVLFTSHIQDVQKEIIDITAKSKNPNSILRSTSLADLKRFSWVKVHEELKQKTPRFLRFVQCAAEMPTNRRKSDKVAASLPALLSSACKLLSVHDHQLSLMQHMNSIILSKGGCKKVAYTRMNAMNDCTSYKVTLDKMSQIAEEGLDEVKDWAKDCNEDNKKERLLMSDISAATPEEKGPLVKTLQEHRQVMHPGYHIVGDNVDFVVKARHQTISLHDKDVHMFQLVANLNRVPANHLDPTTSVRPVATAPFSLLLPSQVERYLLNDNLAFQVARIWTKYIPALGSITMPKHIPHSEMHNTKKKTQQVQ